MRGDYNAELLYSPLKIILMLFNYLACTQYLFSIIIIIVRVNNYTCIYITVHTQMSLQRRARQHVAVVNEVRLDTLLCAYSFNHYKFNIGFYSYRILFVSVK